MIINHIKKYFAFISNNNSLFQDYRSKYNLYSFNARKILKERKTCFDCKNEIKKTINSHTIPESMLKRIAINNQVSHLNTINLFHQKNLYNIFQKETTKKATIFNFICNKCDLQFNLYEKSPLTIDNQNLMLIAKKTLVSRIEKYTYQLLIWGNERKKLEVLRHEFSKESGVPEYLLKEIETPLESNMIELFIEGNRLMNLYRNINSYEITKIVDLKINKTLPLLCHSEFLYSFSQNAYQFFISILNDKVYSYIEMYTIIHREEYERNNNIYLDLNLPINIKYNLFINIFTEMFKNYPNDFIFNPDYFDSHKEELKAIFLNKKDNTFFKDFFKEYFIE